MMKKMMNKVITIVMMGFVFLSPLSSSALAAPKGERHQPQRQEQTIQRHEKKMVPHQARHDSRREISRAPEHRHDSRRNDRGALVGGLILGVILGAAIADANAN